MKRKQDKKIHTILITNEREKEKKEKRKRRIRIKKYIRYMLDKKEMSGGSSPTYLVQFYQRAYQLVRLFISNGQQSYKLRLLSTYVDCPSRLNVQ